MQCTHRFNFWPFGHRGCCEAIMVWCVVWNSHALYQPLSCFALWTHIMHKKHLCSCIDLWLLLDSHSRYQPDVWLLAIWPQGVLWGHYGVMIAGYDSHNALHQLVRCITLWKHIKHQEHLCSCNIMWLLWGSHSRYPPVWLLTIWLQGVSLGH